jgi:hypothetical protein
MKSILSLSLFGAIALALSTPASAHWFDTPHFKAKYPDWSQRFSEHHTKLRAAQEAVKAARAAHKAEKDKAKRAELGKAIPQKAAWAAEVAWLKLHLEWKPFDVKKSTEQWDARMKKIDEAAAAYKKPEALVGPRNDLWKAEKAWIEANRAWKKAESEYHIKHWTERVTKLEGLLAK